MTCNLCDGSGLIDTLNVWEIQRRSIFEGAGLNSYDSVEAMPMLKHAVRCPSCHSQEVTDRDMNELKK